MNFKTDRYEIIHEGNESMFHIFIGNNKEEYGRKRTFAAAMEEAIEATSWEQDYYQQKSNPKYLFP